MDASFSLRLFVTDSEVTYYYGWEKRSPQPEAKDRTWQSKFPLDLANLALWIVSKAVLYFSKKNLIRFTQSKLIHFKLEKNEISTIFLKCTLLQNRPLFQAICPGCLWARDNRWHLSRIQRLAGPAKGHGPFLPVGGSTRDKRPNPFIPIGNTNPTKRVTFLSRLVAPTQTKGPFCPGWCYNPG